MASQKVRVVPKLVFEIREVSSGELIGEFGFNDEWNSMFCLKGDLGKVIVPSQGAGNFKLPKPEPMSPLDCTLIQASPDVIAAIQRAKVRSPEVVDESSEDVLESE